MMNSDGIILHDTHHRVMSRCHELRNCEVVMVMTEAAWCSTLPPSRNPRWHDNATIDDYELHVVESVDRKNRIVKFSDGTTMEYTSKCNIVTTLADGPDPLYASTEELRENGWVRARLAWGLSS